MRIPPSDFNDIYLFSTLFALLLVILLIVFIIFAVNKISKAVKQNSNRYYELRKYQAETERIKAEAMRDRAQMESERK